MRIACRSRRNIDSVSDIAMRLGSTNLRDGMRILVMLHVIVRLIRISESSKRASSIVL